MHQSHRYNIAASDTRSFLLWDLLMDVYVYAKIPQKSDEEKAALRDQLLTVVRSGTDIDVLAAPMHPAYKYSPFEFAVICMHDLELADELLARGANLNRQDVYGNTLAHNIVLYPQPLHLLEYLVDKGADVTIPNVRGQTLADSLEKRIVSFYEYATKEYANKAAKADADAYAAESRAILAKVKPAGSRKPNTPKP